MKEKIYYFNCCVPCFHQMSKVSEKKAVKVEFQIKKSLPKTPPFCFISFEPTFYGKTIKLGLKKT